MKKTKNILLLALSLFTLVSCHQAQKTQTEEVLAPAIENAEAAAFFARFEALCGKAYKGTETYIQEGIDSWADMELMMYVVRCDADTILVPFRVGDNRSRTWMFMVEDGQLRFRHDHRHEDGSAEDLNLYGGFSNQKGTAFKQVFPADDYTCKMLERICDNEWTVEFSEDLSSYNYSLRKKGELIITISFDLTQPLDFDPEEIRNLPYFNKID